MKHANNNHAGNCPTCGSPPGHCYSLCPESPDFYSPEQERADSEYADSLSDSEWLSRAHREHERTHGHPCFC